MRAICVGLSLCYKDVCDWLAGCLTEVLGTEPKASHLPGKLSSAVLKF